MTVLFLILLIPFSPKNRVLRDNCSSLNSGESGFGLTSFPGKEDVGGAEEDGCGGRGGGEGVEVEVVEVEVTKK
jgi:hypothetical protein